MTAEQEEAIRSMLEGFIKDPADSDFQEGFLSAVCVIAVEVLGFRWDDPLIVRAQVNDAHPQVPVTLAKVRPTLTVIDGDKL
jgi:hypothetical protein